MTGCFFSNCVVAARGRRRNFTGNVGDDRNGKLDRNTRDCFLHCAEAAQEPGCKLHLVENLDPHKSQVHGNACL